MARRSDSPPRTATVDEALHTLLRLMPQVVAGLKRAAIPPEVRPLFTASELGPRHIPVLSYLLLEGAMTVGELAARLGVSPATASLMVSELNRHALVERAEDEADRRRTIVTIAEDKRPSIERWLAARAEPMRRTLQQLRPRERRAFIDALALLADELHQGEQRTLRDA